MRFEYSGSIWLSNTGKKMNPFIDVVRELFEDEDDYEYYNKYLKEIDYSSNQIDVYGSRDFDDMEAMKAANRRISSKNALYVLIDKKRVAFLGDDSNSKSD